MSDFHSNTLQNRTVNNFDIPIFQKLYDFYNLLYQFIKLFPKKDRYSLGQRIEDRTLEVFEYFFQIPQTKKEEKFLLLQKASVKLDLLKVLVRLAKDVQALDNKKYIQLECMLQEIGKMLGGWLKAAKHDL